MTDIVERLREKRGVLDNRWPGPSAMDMEAADEIDALRAALSWIENLDPQLGEAAREKFLEKRLESSAVGQGT